MAEPTPTKLPEGLVAGKYKITRLVGKGGMGSVFEGIHTTLGTRVAIKFIDAEYAVSDDVRQRFLNEARAAASLRSKHVVQVYDQGVGTDGRPYIVMEYLEGEPLDQRVERLGRLPPEETARIVLHVCRALAKAHEAGIVHRDLKPENIFLVHDAEDATTLAKVVDFGIAKFTDPTQPGSSSTRTGAVLGTPQYMSPEQARGLRGIDQRTDLWSLGVIVYQCIVGKMPFRGEAVGDLLVNICTSDAAPPSSITPDVPSGFDAFIARALKREPADRFQSAAEFADALSSVFGVDARLGPAGGVASGANAMVAPSPTPRAITADPLVTTQFNAPRSRRPMWMVALAAFVVLGIAGTVASRLSSRTTPGPVPIDSESPSGREAVQPAPSAGVVPEIAPTLPSAAESPSATASAAAKREESSPGNGAGKRRSGAASPSTSVQVEKPPPPATTTRPPQHPADELGY